MVVLDSAGRISGTGSYQGFGQVNARPFYPGSPHYTSSGNVPTVTMPIPTEMEAQARALFTGVSTRVLRQFPSGTAGGYVNWDGAWTGFNGDYGHVYSGWSGWKTTGSWALDWNITGYAFLNYGFDAEAVEYRLKQQGAAYMWTPFRFPGQYYDAETDTAANWHRFYDAFTGRFRGPEPMLQEPGFALAMAQEGRAAPPYAYALNNPLGYVDLNGEDPGWYFDHSWDAAFDFFRYTRTRPALGWHPPLRYPESGTEIQLVGPLDAYTYLEPNQAALDHPDICPGQGVPHEASAHEHPTPALGPRGLQRAETNSGLGRPGWPFDFSSLFSDIDDARLLGMGERQYMLDPEDRIWSRSPGLRETYVPRFTDWTHPW